MIPARAGERGFTLLELLVAITLLGLLMAALFGGLRLGARAWETSGQRQDDSARLQVVQDFLRERLSQAYPLQLEDPLGELATAFEGGQRTLRFATLLPDHLGAGLQMFALRLVERDGLAHLLLAWQPLDQALAVEEEARPPEERLLITDIVDLRFAYFGALSERVAPEWHGIWDSRQARLPELIRIEIVFAEDDPRRWPPLTVRPMIDPSFLM